MTFSITPSRGMACIVFCTAMLLLPHLATGQETPAEPQDSTASAQQEKNSLQTALEEGWQAIRVARYQQAETKLKQAAGAKDPEIKAQALYALGYLWQYRLTKDDIEQAMSYYSQAAEIESNAAAWAMMAQARHLDMPESEKDRDVDAARAMYLSIRKQYPNHMAAHEAAYRYANLLLEQAGNPDAQKKGLEYLQTFIDKHPDSFMAPTMAHDIGKVYIAHKQWAEAVDAFTLADRLDQKFKEKYGKRSISFNKQSVFYYQTAQILENELGDFASAIQWYRKFLNAGELTRDGRRYWAEKSIQRLQAKIDQNAEGQE